MGERSFPADEAISLQNFNLKFPENYRKINFNCKSNECHVSQCFCQPKFLSRRAAALCYLKNVKVSVRVACAGPNAAKPVARWFRKMSNDESHKESPVD